MKSIVVLLVAFVCIGVFARDFSARTRLLVFLVAAGVVAYVAFG